MQWNSLEFYEHLSLCSTRYEAENAWFSKQAWGDPIHYFLNAFRLYRAANRASLGMLILGGAKLRKDQSLLANFGVATAGGVSDPEEKKMVEKAQADRRGVPDATTVLSGGSILSDANWTPLLNDAFIIAGAHAGHEFHFAEDAAEGFIAEASASRGTKDRWNDFFDKNPQIFFFNGAPRVLARELMGLKAFGYRPVFERQQLSFYCHDQAKARKADFGPYLDAVLSAKFHTRDQNAVIGSIDGFLFD